MTIIGWWGIFWISLGLLMLAFDIHDQLNNKLVHWSEHYGGVTKSKKEEIYKKMMQEWTKS